MTGHLVVDADAKTVSGGTVPLDDPDLRSSRAADELVGIITGTTDPVQGFMQGKYDLQGDIENGTRLATTMNELTAMLPE